MASFSSSKETLSSGNETSSEVRDESEIDRNMVEEDVCDVNQEQVVQEMVRHLDHQARELIQASDYEAAVRILEELLEFYYRHINNPPYFDTDDIVHAHDQLGGALQALSIFDGAHEHYVQALVLHRCSHGDDNAVVRSLEETIEGVKERIIVQQVQARVMYLDHQARALIQSEDHEDTLLTFSKYSSVLSVG